MPSYDDTPPSRHVSPFEAIRRTSEDGASYIQYLSGGFWLGVAAALGMAIGGLAAIFGD